MTEPQTAAMPEQKLKDKLIDAHLFRYKASYLVQSLIATVYILVIYFVLDILQGWAITSLAASSFIAFTFPQAASSRPRYLIGGYFIATVTGPLFSLALRQLQDMEVVKAQVLCCGLAMFITMLLMVSFDCEHPPAAAMAITLVLTPDESLSIGIAGLLCVMVLCGIKRLLLPWLRNL